MFLGRITEYIREQLKVSSLSDMQITHSVPVWPVLVLVGPAWTSIKTQHMPVQQQQALGEIKEAAYQW